MQTNLEFITSKIYYPIDIYTDQTFIKGAQDNLKSQTDKLQKARQVVIGDLHGNLNKALETMILSDLIKIPETDLKKFYDLFADSTSYSDKAKIEAMIDCLQSIEWSDQNKSMIFIGDILADRVGNDIVSLSFFEILRKAGANIEVLVGNHDHACDFLNRENANAIKLYSNSFSNACTFFEDSTSETQEQIINQYDNFFENSKLILFNNSAKTLFVHASIRKLNFTTAVKLLKKLEIVNTDFELSCNSFLEFCDKLNKFYVDYKVNRKYQDQKYCIENKFLKSIDADGNRKSEGWLWAGEHWFESDNDYFLSLQIVKIVHGHDSDSKKSRFSPSYKNYKSDQFTVINLDNLQGKDNEYKNSSSPLYIL